MPRFALSDLDLKDFPADDNDVNGFVNGQSYNDEVHRLVASTSSSNDNLDDKYCVGNRGGYLDVRLADNLQYSYDEEEQRSVNDGSHSHSNSDPRDKQCTALFGRPQQHHNQRPGRLRFCMDLDKTEKSENKDNTQNKQGRSRTAQKEALEHYKLRHGYPDPYCCHLVMFHPIRGSNLHQPQQKDKYQQQYPSLQTLLDSETASTTALRSYQKLLHNRTSNQQARLLSDDRNDHDADLDVDQILQQILHGSSQFALSASGPGSSNSSALQLRHQQQKEEQEHLQIMKQSKQRLLLQQRQHQHQDRGSMDCIHQEMAVEQARFHQDHKAAHQGLSKVLRKMEQQERQRWREEQDCLAQEERAAAMRAAQQDAEEKEALQAAEEQAEMDRQQQAEKERLRREQDSADEALRELAAKRLRYIAEGKGLAAQLAEIRAAVASFEKSPEVAKRRLAMKKVVNGKVNTLAENVEKIQSVASDVTQALTLARQEDDLARQASGPEVASVGDQYLTDLLGSKMVVRAQAEGFNGPRGDGFPLANMLALVSSMHRDINPLLEGHIYTVCPTAIPTLPRPSPDVSEEELMESLGMLKGKHGSYETFERFLSRTEGLVSLVANIMSSQPATHSLFGGHNGSILWLERFLNFLPDAPTTPLPLLTAPVLDAFLCGAGHMLANIHADEFKKHLNVIINDTVNRLDEGAIGMPSSIRLKKTIAGGFDSFQKNMPPRAMRDLYLGADEKSIGGHGTLTSSSPFHQKAQSSSAATASGTMTTKNANPFGGNQSSNPSPFGFGSMSSALASSGSTNENSISMDGMAEGEGSSAFGASPSKPPSFSSFPSSAAPSPFGFVPSSAPVPLGGSNFGSSSTTTTKTQPSPFGKVAPAPTPFGIAAGPAPTSFGGAAGAINSSPFVGSTTSSIFGGGIISAPMPFGSSSAPGPSPSPFATPFGGAVAPVTSPFKTGGAAVTTQSPFGAGVATGSPFGAGTATPAPSTFGAPPFGSNHQSAGPSAFGSNAAPNPSPFGMGIPSGPGESPFGLSTSNPSPFSIPASNSPFGPPVSTTPFGAGVAPSPSPYGSASNSTTSLGGSSPFGSPFGGSTGQSHGGGFGGAPLPSYGGKQSGTRSVPCKFFAAGYCRNGDSCNFSHEKA